MLLATGIEVGTSRHTSVGVVAKFMDMEAMQASLQTCYFAGNFDRVGLRLENYQKISIVA